MIMATEEKNESTANQLNVLRGAGPSSRILLDFDKLRNAGWVISERKDGTNKTHFKYVTPESKTLKSAKDVESKLRQEGMLELFLKEDEVETQTPLSSCSRSKEIDAEDPDYEPPLKQMKMSQAEDTMKW